MTHMTHPKNWPIWPIDPWPIDPLFTLGGIAMRSVRCDQLLQCSGLSCPSACASVGRKRELCKNTWTYRDAVWNMGSWGPRDRILRGGRGLPHWKNNFFAETGVILGHARRRYVQPYSQRDSSDAELAIFTLATVWNIAYVMHCRLLPTSRVQSHFSICIGPMQCTCI